MRTCDQTLEAVSADLLSTGLLSHAELRRLISHAAGFRALPRHRLFLEFRIQRELKLEGYGHGFDAGELPTLLESLEDFAAGERLKVALAEDPFAEDRRRYLDLEDDGDPEWVEYDYSNERFADGPGVFFSIPSRFRGPATEARLDALEAMLGTLMPRPSPNQQNNRAAYFWDFYRALVILEQSRGKEIGLYRLGLCTARQPGWVRLIKFGLSRDSLDTIGEQLFPQYRRDPIGWIVDHLSESGDGNDPQIAASISVVNGVVRSIDLECPYFHKIPDKNLRAKSYRFLPRA